MKISPIGSQAFKGLLVVPDSSCSWSDHWGNNRKESPKLEVETNDIIEINNNRLNETHITYIDKNMENKKHIFYHDGSDFSRSRILLAYTAAATQKDVIVKA